MITVDDIGLGKLAVVACFGIEKVEAIGTRAKVDSGALQIHSWRSVSVAHDYAARRGGKRIFHQPKLTEKQ